jgi:hypothetical protein
MLINSKSRASSFKTTDQIARKVFFMGNLAGWEGSGLLFKNIF